MITWTKRLLLTLTFLALLATNILTLTSADFNAALIWTDGIRPGRIRTVSSMMQTKDRLARIRPSRNIGSIDYQTQSRYQKIWYPTRPVEPSEWRRRVLLLSRQNLFHLLGWLY